MTPDDFVPSAGKYEGLWVMENEDGLRWSIDQGAWVTEESGEFTSWTDGEVEQEVGDSDDLDALATKRNLPAGEWVNINEA